MTTQDWPDPARGKKLRQLIGIARRQLGVADEAHAARVRRLTQGRATSASDCTLAELELILREYKACGFVPAPPRTEGTRGGQPAPAPAERWQSPTGMLAKVAALIRALNALSPPAEHKNMNYAIGILRQQKGLPKGVACRLELATAEELRGVIAALHRQLKRLEARAAQAEVDAATAWLTPPTPDAEPPRAS